MSAQKRAGVVASVNSGMVAGEHVHHRRVWAHTKLWAVVVTCILVIALGCGAVYSTVVRKNSASSSTANKPKGTAYDRAFGASLNGHPAAFQSILDKQLQAAKTPEKKVAIYQQKMATALNASQYAQAIQWGKQAETIKLDSETASMVSTAYQSEGDKAEAKAWAQKAISELSKTDPLYDRKLESYQSQLAGLGS